MSYQLVIAEKPSVAKSIAAVIGAKERKDNYLEGNGYRVTWCFGHLTRFLMPEEIDEKYKSWAKDLLPILPENFQFKVQEGKEEQFAVIKRLMEDPETDGVINACDAGREGEAIFRNVYELAGCTKPMQRLWISSMEDEAIREGFQNLRPGSIFDRLYNAARCRAEADWIVGINATRLFSRLYEEKLNTGRVVSPTLTAITTREKEISEFLSRPFYRVELDLDGFTALSDKFQEKVKAEEAEKDTKGASATVKEIVTERHVKNSPMLYDLTSLQRDANRRHGYTAQQTLDYLQSLYEKKLTTYPRTDSRYLTSGMQESTKELFAAVLKKKGFPSFEMKSGDRTFDDSKVSDHHAILPTLEIENYDMESLTKGELAILEMLYEQLLLAFSEPCEYEDTEITLDCAGYLFMSKARRIVTPGYRTVAQFFHNSEDRKEKKLPELTEGQKISVKGNRLKEDRTRPPKHFTEDTLLSFMENAEESETVGEAERKGLGTPATRAGIIEKLVHGGFIRRKQEKKQAWLIPTRLGTVFASILPESLRSAKLTSEWEEKLEKIKTGELSCETFREEIQNYVKELVENYRRVDGFEELFSWRHETIGTCPRCGGKVVERPKSFSCMKDGCGFIMWKNSRFFENKKKVLDADLAKKILSGQPVYLAGCYSSGKEKTYDAIVTLKDDGQETQYMMEFARKKGA